MRTRRFAGGISSFAALAAAVFLPISGRAADGPVISPDLMKQLAQLIGSSDLKAEVKIDAKTEATLKDLLAQLQAAIAALQAQLTAEDTAEPVPTGGTAAATINVASSDAPARSGPAKSGLQASAIQGSTGIQSGARGRTAETEWRAIFPKRQ